MMLIPENSSADLGEDFNDTNSSRRLSLSKNMWGRTLDKVENWLKKDVENRTKILEPEDIGKHLCDSEELEAFKRNPSRKTLPGLPRPQTFQRQNSERRERLCPYEPKADERRAISVDRRVIASYVDKFSSTLPQLLPSQSAPDVSTTYDPSEDHQIVSHDVQDATGQQDNINQEQDVNLSNHTLQRVPSMSLESVNDEAEKLQIQSELEAKWVLNLSMHFKDHSDREKFFVTYAEKPNKWRRLTISIDYRNIIPDSLEADLKALQYQREKSARIYESIRESLPDIQFYETVTNLKLKTIDERLHIHCSEDVNEIIKYPHVSLLSHIPYPVYKESDVVYQSHMSGYVYRVGVQGQTLVKKEIPGPDSVDEFIYEANALSVLKGSQNVIEFHGLIIDDEGGLIKGLLINLASRGALVDILYDSRFVRHPISWSRREYWARQIVNGLSEIHEAGFVQGDFTLSNIVVHEDDRISLIDINRRGCPVGWEPPELMRMIHSGQRISMFIGVKTDLFQLGMVLWAIAMMNDEPEREPKPLRPINQHDVPLYFQEIVSNCLQADPRRRLSARDLLKQFPPTIEHSIHDMLNSNDMDMDLRSDGNHFQDMTPLPGFSTCPTYVDAAAQSECYFDSRDSGIFQDEARDASPMMQFTDDEEPISTTDFEPFAIIPDDAHAVNQLDEDSHNQNIPHPIQDADADAMDEDHEELNLSSPSATGTLTPRPTNCQIQQSLDGMLDHKPPINNGQPSHSVSSSMDYPLPLPIQSHTADV